MKALYCLSFGKKTEWIDTGAALVENPLGTVLLTLLTTDFDVFLEKLTVGTEDHTMEDARLAESVAVQIRALHPFLENALLPMFFEAEKVDWLRHRLLKIKKLQAELASLVDEVLLPDESGCSCLQRLCMQQSRDTMLAAKLAGLSEFLRVERRSYIDGHPFEPVLSPAQEIAPPMRITSRQFVGSDDLQSVLLMELEEMAQQNVHIKKCAYCGGYFQPFSTRTVYCDQQVGETGKSCKELAAKELYEKKIAADEGLSLYQRRNKAYAMRVSRAPEIYKDQEYQAWKRNAEAMVKRYVAGEISLALLDASMKLPSTKQAG